MAVKTEANRLNDVLLWEPADVRYSREKIVLLSGENLKVGAVLGRRLVSPTYGAAAALSTNVGTGTVSAPAAATNLGAQRGVYRLVCLKAVTDAGRFGVYDPSGIYLGDAVVGVEWDDQVKFTISDGGTDFEVGDAFTIPVTGGTYKYKEHDAADADGGQRAEAILGVDTDATAADVNTWAIVRDAIVKDSGLVWFAGATAAQKTTAKDRLAAKGIIARADA